MFERQHRNLIIVIERGEGRFGATIQNNERKKLNVCFSHSALAVSSHLRSAFDECIWPPFSWANAKIADLSLEMPGGTCWNTRQQVGGTRLMKPAAHFNQLISSHWQNVKQAHRSDDSELAACCDWREAQKKTKKKTEFNFAQIALKTIRGQNRTRDGQFYVSSSKRERAHVLVSIRTRTTQFVQSRKLKCQIDWNVEISFARCLSIT